MMLKQVLLVRTDLKMPAGKTAAQAAHASVEAVLRCDKDVVREWRVQGMMKVALKVSGEKELYAFIQHAKDAGITTSVITDAGKTVVAPGTVTCGAIGPAEEHVIDAITGSLKLL